METALPGVMRYISSGQDTGTTRVSSFNFVPHKSRKRCINTKCLIFDKIYFKNVWGETFHG